MIRRQVCIAHGHGDGGVPEDALQTQDVTTAHHVMAGEGVPEDVSHLARSMEAATLVSRAECRPAGHEQPSIPRHPHL